MLRLEKINGKNVWDILKLSVSYEPENENARRLYASYGFKESGEMDGEEVIAVLRLS